MLIDSHCHLDYLAKDQDVEALLERAKGAGVGGMVTISTRLSTFPEVLKIAKSHPDLCWCSVGVHPHHADEEGLSDPAQLVELAGDPAVVGIGETGLDYYYDNAPREDQQRSFRAHIAAARETGLPLIVHTRDADEDTVAILKDEYEKGAYPGLIHCFTAGPELAASVLELGFYISVSGIVTFKRSDELRETLSGVPLERLLVETDAPFLAPVPHRGKTNEPSYVGHTAAALAELKGVGFKELEETTTANFYKLFSKAAPPAQA
jgi:TatD DNase family protein